MGVDTSVLDARIDSLSNLTNGEKEEAKKDTHLIMTAQSHKIIFSIEVVARQLYEANRQELPRGSWHYMAAPPSQNRKYV